MLIRGAEGTPTWAMKVLCGCSRARTMFDHLTDYITEFIASTRTTSPCMAGWSSNVDAAGKASCRFLQLMGFATSRDQEWNSNCIQKRGSCSLIRLHQPRSALLIHLHLPARPALRIG